MAAPTAEELLQEIREARTWLRRQTTHLMAFQEVRDPVTSASGACHVLQYHLEHPEAGVKVAETLAELRTALVELGALVPRYLPPPQLLPEHLDAGTFRPVSGGWRIRGIFRKRTKFDPITGRRAPW